MGVLNVTPDSFSDGGRFNSPQDAVDAALRMVDEGADIVDVGGESTRPGATRPTASEELSRVVEVVGELSAQGVCVSIDTMRSEVARAAIAAGARLVNDVSGGLADPQMLPTIAQAGLPCVLMHWRAHSDEMGMHAHYGDVVREVIDELRERVGAAVAAGIAAESVAVDPGIGFAKTGDHNWSLLRGLEDLHTLGHPVLIGASRKRFLGELLTKGGALRDPAGRDDATLATSVLAAAAGAWGVRVHSVAGTVDALKVVTRWEQATVDQARGGQG
jgi:dihydropteroate synthase